MVLSITSVQNILLTSDHVQASSRQSKIMRTHMQTCANKIGSAITVNMWSSPNTKLTFHQRCNVGQTPRTSTGGECFTTSPTNSCTRCTSPAKVMGYVSMSRRVYAIHNLHAGWVAVASCGGPKGISWLAMVKAFRIFFERTPASKLETWP